MSSLFSCWYCHKLSWWYWQSQKSIDWTMIRSYDTANTFKIINFLTSHNMSRIYLTQSQLDKIPSSQKTETHIIEAYQCLTSWDITKKSYPYTIIWNKKTLTCSCCWTKTKWRQWYNRDKWFGICSSCYQEEYQRALDNGSTADDLADIKSNYGIYWVHFGKLTDYILQS